MEHIITLSHADRIQLFTLRQALRLVVKTEGRMHLTNPAIVRRAALVWLAKVGSKANTRTRWATLLSEFEATFGRAMDEAKAQEEGQQG